MINGAHIILYSTDAEADRVFIRDVLGFAGVDAGDGWLILSCRQQRSPCILQTGQASTSST
jgi:hypothetical protein